MAIEAEFFALGTRLVVSFDKPIVNQPLSAANWFVTHTRGDHKSYSCKTFTNGH